MANTIWKKRKALLAIQADRLHMNSIGLHRILRKLISVVFFNTEFLKIWKHFGYDLVSWRLFEINNQVSTSKLRTESM